MNKAKEISTYIVMIVMIIGFLLFMTSSPRSWTQNLGIIIMIIGIPCMFIIPKFLDKKDKSY